MASDNMVCLTGNVTREIELRYTPTGRAVGTFGIAVNRRWQNKATNEWEEEVSFFNVVCWSNLAENVAQSITKGARVVVAGRLQQRSWETDEGDKRSVVELVADEVAASLRWATVEVTRNERTQAGQQATDEEYVPPTEDAPADKPKGKAGKGAKSQPDPIYGDEEEPFVRDAQLGDL